MTVQTLKGEMKSNDLGVTFIHEHLYVVPNDLKKYYDYTFDDVEKSIEEVEEFKKFGGDTIVDMTPMNYGRNPIALEEISNRTSVNIIFATGFHKEEFLPNWIRNASEEDIYEVIETEIKEGVSSHFLKPSVMKIGTSNNHITSCEMKVIRVAGQIQKYLDIPIVTHCDNGTCGIEQIRFLTENGASPNKICLSHVDLTLDVNYISELCQTGAYISFDHIGRDLEDNDAKRIEILSELVKRGYADRICLAGDMGRKKYFKSYGGKPGLKYILTDFREYSKNKIDEIEYSRMISDNPQNFLDW